MGIWPRTTIDILQSAQDTLSTALRELHDVQYSNDPERQLVGFQSAIVYGRSVFDILQQLCKTEFEFDMWYAPYEQAQNRNALIKYFGKIRNVVMKKGELPVDAATQPGKEFYFANSPKELADFPIYTLTEQYLAYIAELLTAARKKFGKASPPS